MRGGKEEDSPVKGASSSLLFYSLFFFLLFSSVYVNNNKTQKSASSVYYQLTSTTTFTSRYPSFPNIYTHTHTDVTHIAFYFSASITPQVCSLSTQARQNIGFVLNYYYYIILLTIDYRCCLQLISAKCQIFFFWCSKHEYNYNLFKTQGMLLSLLFFNFFFFFFRNLWFLVQVTPWFLWLLEFD